MKGVVFRVVLTEGTSVDVIANVMRLMIESVTFDLAGEDKVYDAVENG